MTVSLSVDEVESAPIASFRSAPLHRFLRNKIATVAACMIVLLLLLCIFGPMFLVDANKVDLGNTLKGPSSHHWLGTDDLGRDLLARVLVGTRVSFLVAIGATLTALVPAVILGMLAGYYGWVMDDVLSRVFDILLAIPTLLLAIVIVNAVGPSLSSIIIAIGIADIPRYGRLTRALTMKVKETEYVRNGVALGYSDLRLMTRHVLPNIYVSILVIATGRFGGVALAEASLSFLGVGIQPPKPSLGNIVSEAQQYLRYDAIFAIAPGAALTLLTLSFCFFGDGLRDAFDVRDQGTR
jgi:peptide/nickel transport system permease protein